MQSDGDAPVNEPTGSLSRRLCVFAAPFVATVVIASDFCVFDELLDSGFGLLDINNPCSNSGMTPTIFMHIQGGS